MPYVRRDDGQRNELIVGMVDGGAGVLAPIVKDRKIGNALVSRKHEVLVPERLEDLERLPRRETRKVGVVVARDQEIVISRASHGEIGAVAARRGAKLSVLKRRKFILDDLELPAVCVLAHKNRLFIAAFLGIFERAGPNRRADPLLLSHRILTGALPPAGRDHDPVLGDEVLAKFRFFCHKNKDFYAMSSARRKCAQCAHFPSSLGIVILFCSHNTMRKRPSRSARRSATLLLRPRRAPRWRSPAAL